MTDCTQPTKNLFSDLIINSPTLRNLYEKVTLLNHLDEISHSVLNGFDPQLAFHCRVANLRDQTLVLTTDSPVWLHALRYTLNKVSFLKSLKDELFRVEPFRHLKFPKDVCYQISLPLTFQDPSQKGCLKNETVFPARLISFQSAEALRVAAQMVNSTKLSRALLQLVRHQKLP